MPLTDYLYLPRPEARPIDYAALYPGRFDHALLDELSDVVQHLVWLQDRLAINVHTKYEHEELPPDSEGYWNFRATGNAAVIVTVPEALAAAAYTNGRLCWTLPSLADGLPMIERHGCGVDSATLQVMIIALDYEVQACYRDATFHADATRPLMTIVDGEEQVALSGEWKFYYEASRRPTCPLVIGADVIIPERRPKTASVDA
jgi:hypothetical protein